MLRGKYVSIALIIIMLLLVIPETGMSWAQVKPISSESSGRTLMEAFLETGCEAVQININGWALVNREYVSLKKLEVMAREAADYFKLQDGYSFSSAEKQHLRQVNVQGYDPDERILTIILSNGSPSLKRQNENYETYVVVDATEAAEDSSPWMVENKIRCYLKDRSKTPHVSTTFTGSFPGELENMEKEQICVEMFRRLDGEITQTMKENGLISTAGYSPLLKDHIKADRERINLNIALRYSPYWDKTYIWIGTPVITTEY
jgi:hypothetical protein